MQRLNDQFIDIVKKHVPLTSKKVLEIGCGDGKRTVELAPLCDRIVGLDPDDEALKRAEDHKLPNATFRRGVGEKLDFGDQSFDVVLFTISFHHIPGEHMDDALGEAVRVLRPGGSIVFYELGEADTEDEADRLFSEEGQCDAVRAIQTVLGSSVLSIDTDITYQMMFRYDSVEDFRERFEPKKNLNRIESFLEEHDYQLQSNRRVIIAHPRS